MGLVVRTCIYQTVSNTGHNAHLHIPHMPGEKADIKHTREKDGKVRYPGRPLARRLLQWDPSNPDTLGQESTVLIIEVSSFQGLNMYCDLLS